MVNASFAAQLFPGSDPIGRRIRLGRDRTAPPVTIVGLAPDLYIAGAENRDPAGVYLPLAQSGQRALAIAARVSGAPLSLAPSVRALVRSLDRDLPVYLPDSLRLAVDKSLWAYRVFGPLLAVVGVASLFLATLGLYSLMAFAMRQRTREIGLRMAIGARPLDIARLIARRVTTEMSIGLLAGGALAVGLARLMRAMLFHVQPEDPLTFGAIVLALTLSAGIAAVVPVRRAIRVDPTVTLRTE